MIWNKLVKKLLKPTQKIIKKIPEDRKEENYEVYLDTRFSISKKDIKSFKKNANRARLAFLTFEKTSKEINSSKISHVDDD